MSDLKKIIIARHYGFCMGVKRAISTAEDTMSSNRKVTILNEIVHNDAIVKKFADAGVGQAHSIDEIDEGTVIISAHGVSPDIYRRAEKRGLKIIDATCPLVLRIHKIIKKLAENGYFIIHFGDPDHDETVGIIGHAPNRVRVIRNEKDLKDIEATDDKVALTAQTTARISDFEKIEEVARNKFPKLEVFKTICNATNQRQLAIMDLAPRVDLMLIVGSQTSANSKRLAQISQAICGRSYLINSADDIQIDWFDENGRPIETVGLSAGASTPDFLIEGAIDSLKKIGGDNVEVIYPMKKSGKNRLFLKDE